MNQNNRIYSKESLHKAKELLDLQLKKQLRENKLKRIIGEKVETQFGSLEHPTGKVHTHTIEKVEIHIK